MSTGCVLETVTTCCCKFSYVNLFNSGEACPGLWGSFTSCGRVPPVHFSKATPNAAQRSRLPTTVIHAVLLVPWDSACQFVRIGLQSASTRFRWENFDTTMPQRGHSSIAWG